MLCYKSTGIFVQGYGKAKKEDLVQIFEYLRKRHEHTLDMAENIDSPQVITNIKNSGKNNKFSGYPTLKHS